MPTKHAEVQLPAALSMRVRAHLGESAENYIRRQARPNHLKPSVLHSVACSPPNSAGKPRLDRLAALADHPVEHLERALVDGSVPRPRTTVTGRSEKLPQGTYSTCSIARSARRPKAACLRANWLRGTASADASSARR